MQKQTVFYSLVLLSLLAACSKEEPAASKQSAAPEPMPPAAEKAMPEEAATQVAQANGKGKQVYDSLCMACHAAGVAGAPRFGDKAAWSPRIAQGMDTLYQHSIEGFQGKTGVMPPKGGNTSLPDADVKAAVDYMVAQVK